MNYADKVRGKGLVLITGKKGSGKSHFATRIIKDILDTNKDGEYTVYANITGLKIDGVLDAPDDWQDAPNNSIIFYDEAQLLPWADNSSTKIASDPRVFNMTLIRKQNKHIVLMTQDPTFLHSALRKLVDYHYHLSHPFKNGKPKVFYFHGALSTIDDKGVWKKHAQETFTYPLSKDISQLYQSIEPDANHGLKKKIPKKIILYFVGGSIFLFVGLLAFALLAPILYKFYKGIGKQEVTTTEQSSANPASTAPASGGNPQFIQSNFDQKRIEQQLRRLEMYEQDLPPDYAIRRNESALQVRGVIAMHGKCRAYNAYGDVMTLDPSQCRYYAQESGRVFKNTQLGDTQHTPTLDEFNEQTTDTPSFANNLDETQKQGGGVIDSAVAIANPMTPDQ